MPVHLPPHRRSEMPTVAEVQRIYGDAAALPPLCEDARSAVLFASVYGSALQDEQLHVTVARRGDALVGFAYGHPWHWSEQRYAWADELHARLGDEVAEDLDGAFSLNLLAVSPEAAGRGLGTEVLRSWLAGTAAACAWLQTTDLETPALRLYRREGFVPVGHGPDAPNGEPGLVLLRR